MLVGWGSRGGLVPSVQLLDAVAEARQVGSEEAHVRGGVLRLLAAGVEGAHAAEQVDLRTAQAGGDGTAQLLLQTKIAPT